MVEARAMFPVLLRDEMLPQRPHVIFCPFYPRVKDIEKQLLRRFSNGLDGSVILKQGGRVLASRIDVSGHAGLTFDLAPALTWTLRDLTTHEPAIYRFCRKATITSIKAYLARHHFQCDPADIDIKLGSTLVQPADTADTLGLPEKSVTGEVRVNKRGFLRLTFRYLHNGAPLPPGLVPPFPFAFTPKLTVASLRARIAGIMDTDPERVQVFAPRDQPSQKLGAPVPDDMVVRQFWQRAADGTERIPFFTGTPRDLPENVELYDWRTDFSRFNERIFLGKGTFGIVYAARDTKTGQRIALKVAHHSLSSGELADLDHSETFREVAMLIRFNHPAILALTGWCLNGGVLEIGMELLSGALSAELPNIHTKPTRLAIVIIGIVYGMRYIHARGGIHRDLKPANILIDEKGRPQIADLGQCRKVDVNMTIGLGTAAYLAPEVIDGNADYNTPVDVFAFGVMVYELCTGKPAFQGGSHQVLTKISAGVRPPIPSSVCPFAKGLIESCWAGGPAARPTFDAILKAIRDARFIIVPGADPAAVQAYAFEIEALEKACQFSPVVWDVKPKAP
jgi:hypothetical protein